jgi:hypothetical protein
MQVITLPSWDAFEATLKELQSVRERTLLENPRSPSPSPLLFRGHADAEWKLLTTLERYVDKQFSVRQYYEIAYRVKPSVETLTGRKWEMDTPPEFGSQILNGDLFDGRNFPAYEYHAFLRHHGFPSPLLDWSRSPYVAAYFAFANTRAENVAIYTYREYLVGTKIFTPSQPHVCTLGPYVDVHARHYAQQSQYTFCVSGVNKDWTYRSHEEVQRSDYQDEIIKYVIPASERLKALEYFDSFNLNAYSLMGNVDGLMETMALRAFHSNAKY